ncbi:MAG: T9SS type A sorting domain-containing protein [Bacteroidota bacterium]
MRRALLFLLINLVNGAFLNAQNQEIYVSDAGNFGPPNKILKYDENGQNPETFIDTNLNWPQDILFLEDQNVVLVSNLNGGAINKYDIETGDFIETFASVIGGPTRMKIGPDDLIYVLQWSGSGRVLRYQQDGTFVDNFTSIGIGGSIGIDWDSAGNMYVSSYNSDLVRRFDASGNDLGNFISTNLVGPTNIDFQSNGDLIVLDYDGGSIKRFDSNGNFLNVFVSGLSQVEGIDFLDNGNILIGNGGTSAVKMYNDQGVFINDLVVSGLGGLIRPNAVVIRDNPNLSVTDYNLDTLGFLKNSMGSIFYIKEKVIPQIEHIEVYDALGKLMITDLQSTSLIDASTLSKGIYLVKVILQDTQTLSQRIVVM